MVLATILLHNMMVEECIKNEEMEGGSFYNTLCNECDNENSNDEDESDGGGYENSPVNRHDKSKMVNRRWEELYDYKGSKELKDLMKRHLYIEKYGHDELTNAHLSMDNYTPLSIYYIKWMNKNCVEK
jgi:hypothetical protein